MVKKQLPYIFAFAAVFLGLNAIPWVQHSGAHHWFARSVPDPERFAMRRAPPATLTYGYPLTFYSQNGREFTRKGGDMLFWPSPEQGPISERFSFLAIVGDVAFALGISLLAKFSSD